MTLSLGPKDQSPGSVSGQCGTLAPVNTGSPSFSQSPKHLLGPAAVSAAAPGPNWAHSCPALPTDLCL